MSVETPMGGAAYADQPGNPPGCSGRVGGFGVCYFNNHEYLGYFDPKKCYSYNSSSDYFEPVGATNALHECSGQWSGNFLNWATMTAIDEFIWTMTGGNRVVDTKSLTIIKRARRHSNDNWYPKKKLRASLNVDPSTVTPFSDSEIFITNEAFKLKIGTTDGGSQNGIYEVRVKVCDPTMPEDNCTQYSDGGSTYWKPEGLIQRNADFMRFAVTSYSLDNSKSRDGGVLRSNMKFVGPKMPDGSGGTTTNPKMEIDEDGLLINNPDGAGGGLNSGVINYINKFSEHGYKSYDPASELYYESIRYFMNLGRTPEYANGLSDAQKGGFQVLTNWSDPIQYKCQKNFIIGINDANPWRDKKLPGTCFNNSTVNGKTVDDGDYGEPTNASSFIDPDSSSQINVCSLTNTVGQLEGLNGVTWSNSGTWTSGTLSGTNDSVGGGFSNFDNTCSSKFVSALGEVMGTCPYPGKQNSYYIAGLAYYANTHDIRSDFDDKQTITSFFLDTQEYNSNPLDGNKNMLWLAGKYGGFVDIDNNNEPNLQEEWDADYDGVPDNFVFVTQPEKMVIALNKAFKTIKKSISSAASAAASSTSLTTNSKVFQARFDSSDWSGQLLSYDIDLSGTISSTANWDAGDKMPSNRTIITFGRDSKDGIPFTWSAISGLSDTTQKDLLNQNGFGTADNLGNDRVDFLRGSEIKGFRTRSSKLGDIVHSAPFFVGPPKAGYIDSSYATFAASKASREPMIYVGANDGMLHGFAAATGEEKIAYVPGSVYKNLSALTNSLYGRTLLPHRYYVDSSPMVADAEVNSSWKTILAGGLNGGGQGYYALDISNPSNFSESKAADLVLWEFTDEDDADLGYTYNQPPLNFLTHQSAQIAKMNNGKWALIVGNGYNNSEDENGACSDSDPATLCTASSTGHAALFILFLEGGIDGDWTDSGDYIKIDTGIGNTSTPNGLATPMPIDTDGDGDIDLAYAGDLRGNLWKFNLKNSDPTKWKKKKLFQAKDSNGKKQPITTAPIVVPHPQGGYMVSFGTGKYLEQSDLSTSTTQTLYGLWDNRAGGGVSTITNRNALVEQKVIGVKKVAGIDYRLSTKNSVDYTNKRGWYMDLPTSGERVAYNPIARDQRSVFVTMIPDSSDPCAAGGYGWIMELDYLNGSRLDEPPFDVNGDNKINNNDKIAYDEDSDGTDENLPPTGKKLDGIPTTPAVLDKDKETEVKIISQSTGALGTLLESKPAGIYGRLSWRQLFGN